MLPTTIGSYPRPEWFRIYLKRLEGLQKQASCIKIDKDKYRKAVEDVIDEQRKAGIVLFTDGQLAWQDFLFHITTRISGFEPNGLVRYFDNNTYYRRPIVKGRLERVADVVAHEFRIAKKIENEIKPVLSLFTIIKSSSNEFYKDEKEFIFDLARIMREEVKELVRCGARYIQFDEPSLLDAGREEMSMAKDAFDMVTKGIDAKFFLITYFKDAAAIFPEILDFEVDVIGLDFVDGYERNSELIKDYTFDKGLNIGVVDARNTKIEDREEMMKRVNNIIEDSNLKSSDVFISPNTGLEFLPWAKAFEKMKLVGAISEAGR